MNEKNILQLIESKQDCQRPTCSKVYSEWWNSPLSFHHKKKHSIKQPSALFSVSVQEAGAETRLRRCTRLYCVPLPSVFTWQKLINLLQTKLDKMLNFQWPLAISTNWCVVEMLSTVYSPPGSRSHGVRVSLWLIIIIGRKKYGCLPGWAGCDSQPVLCLWTVLSDHQLVLVSQ